MDSNPSAQENMPGVPLQPTPQVPIPNRNWRFNPLFLFPILLLALAIATAVITFRPTKQAIKPLPSPSTISSLPSAQTESIKGKTTSFKNNLLVLKKEDGQEIQIQIATGTAILKQQWFNDNSMGTVPAEIKTDDNLSLQAAKNNSGEIEILSVIILADDKDQSIGLWQTSQSAGEKTK